MWLSHVRLTCFFFPDVDRANSASSICCQSGWFSSHCFCFFFPNACIYRLSAEPDNLLNLSMKIHSKASYFGRVQLVKKPAKTLVDSTHCFHSFKPSSLLFEKNWSIESLILSFTREFWLFPTLTTDHDCNGNSSCKILRLTDGSRALRTREPSQFWDRWKYVEKRTLSYTTSRQRFLGLTAVWIFCIVSFILFPGSPARFTETKKRGREKGSQF